MRWSVTLFLVACLFAVFGIGWAMVERSTRLDARVVAMGVLARNANSIKVSDVFGDHMKCVLPTGTVVGPAVARQRLSAKTIDIVGSYNSSDYGFIAVRNENENITLFSISRSVLDLDFEETVCSTSIILTRSANGLWKARAGEPQT